MVPLSVLMKRLWRAICFLMLQDPKISELFDRQI